MHPLIERHWGRVEDWLDALLDVPRAEREQWLAPRCADAALRAAVIALADAEAEGERALAGLRGEVAGAPRAGMRVGPYRLLEPLGEGGMALVFLAERTTAEFTQRVAVKLMRAGLLGAAQVDAFRREQRIHAALEHPHIARVFDSGVTPAGLPYFAVEYVDGAPIDRWCDERRLPVEARLRLFVDVCDAVQYAHQNLVVHRDLKPSNILVTTAGEVKLLDFGIAKPIAGDGADATRTATEYRHLTPTYAAPEQFSGGPITTATDVYALGVLLAELLTGRRPPPADADLTTGRRAISRYLRDADAATATQRAAARCTDARTLERRLRGDLDCIVARALAPEPGRRYPSASALRDDVRSHLGGLPVLARPDSLGYRAGKFARRHVVALGAALVVLVTLVAATAVSVTQARRARAEADRAALEADRANAVRAFLLQLFVETAPGKVAPPQTAAEVLERGRAEAERRFADRPELLYDVLTAIGTVELRRGHLPAARGPLERALALAEERFGAGDDRTLEAATNLANHDGDSGRFADGERRLAAAIAAYRAARRGQATRALAAAIVQIGGLRNRLGETAAAVASTAEGLAMTRAVGADADTLVGALQAHADALATSGRAKDALVMALEALERTRAHYGTDHAKTGNAHAGLGTLYRQVGDVAEAQAQMREALRIMRVVHDGPSPDLAFATNGLGVALAFGGRLSEALALFEETLAIQRAVYGDEHPYIATTLGNIGALQTRLGEYESAERTQRDALALMRKLRGPTHPMVVRNEVELGRTLLRRGRLEEAAALIENALRADLAQFPEASQQVAADRLALADLDLARGNVEAAHDGARRAVDAWLAVANAQHPKALEARLVLGRSLLALGRRDEALAELSAVRATARAAQPPATYVEVRALLEEARLARTDGDAARAASLLDEAAATLAASGADEPRLVREIEAARRGN